MNQLEQLFALTHQFKAKRIDNDDWVTGCYFITPLTDENSGTQPECGWFFLTGEQRHCISTFGGVVFVIDPNTLQYIGLGEDISIYRLIDYLKKENSEGKIDFHLRFDGEHFYIHPQYESDESGETIDFYLKQIK